MSNLFLLQQMKSASKEAARSANKLAIQEQSYRQIVEESNDIILLVNRGGNILLANPAAQNCLAIGQQPAEISSVLQPSSLETWEGAASSLDTDTSHWVELQFQGRGGGTVITEGHLSLRLSNRNTVDVLAFLRDVSARKKVEHDLQRSNDHLRRAQKMQAIGRLAGGIAHDFNNLLSVMMGAGSMLKMDLPDGDPRATDVDMILLSAEKGAALARQLLLFSRGQPSQSGTVALVRQTNDLMKILSRTMGSDIKVTFSTNVEEVWVAIDPGQFEQVLMNLVINARDSISNDGSVQIQISVEDSGQVAVVQVTDNGSGMTEEVAQSAFEPFFTTKDLQKGSGLGLSVVYGIISDARGSIDVESTIGTGTAIILRIPTTTPTSRSEPSTSKTVPMSAENNFHRQPEVVLLEDQHELRQLTTRSLELMGFPVRAFESISQLKAEIDVLHTNCDLFITDVKLGDGNGLDFAESMAKKGLLTKVLVITAHANLARIDDLIIRYGWRLLMKPFSPHQLRLVISKLMDDGP